MGFDWKSMLSTVAPTVATALGGPLAGVAAQAGLSALGIEPTDNPEDNLRLLEAKVASATPADLLALKQADQQFKTELRRLDIDEQKLHADDRANARQREATLRDHTPKIIAAIIVCGFFAVQWWIMTTELPAGAREIVLRTLGALDAALSIVLTYYFGSSSGQDERFRREE